MPSVSERTESVPRELSATTAPDTASAVPEPPPQRRRWPYVAAGALLLAGAVVAAQLRPLFFGSPAAIAIAASGRIEGREVTVAPKDIQGRVARLLADEGDTVTRGQLLAELEANPLAARTTGLEAVLANIDAQIRQASLDVRLTAKNSDASIAAAEAAVSAAQARIVRARAVLANATTDRRRAAALLADAVISNHEFDQLDTAVRTSEADLEAAEKDRSRAEADLALARASRDLVAVKEQQVLALRESRRAAAGQLAEAQASLAERRVFAPSDGTIISRPVEVGDVVTPGSPIFQMVDLNRLYLKVYIPEPDIPKIKLGDPADVTVDAFPGRRFAARVSKVHDEAEFTPKNVETAEERLKLVFGVELTFVNPDRLLKPGMPADCTIRHGS